MNSISQKILLFFTFRLNFYSNNYSRNYEAEFKYLSVTSFSSCCEIFCYSLTSTTVNLKLIFTYFFEENFQVRCEEFFLSWNCHSLIRFLWSHTLSIDVKKTKYCTILRFCDFIRKLSENFSLSDISPKIMNKILLLGIENFPLSDNFTPLFVKYSFHFRGCRCHGKFKINFYLLFWREYPGPGVKNFSYHGIAILFLFDVKKTKYRTILKFCDFLRKLSENYFHFHFQTFLQRLSIKFYF